MSIVKRLVVFGLVLMAGACSRLTNVPIAYSALPADPVAGAAASAGPAPTGLADSADPAALLPAVTVPGTLKAVDAQSVPHGVNPNAVLDASARTRMAWGSLRPADLLKPAALAAAGTSSAGSIRPDRPTLAAPTYDREAMMDRLLRGGQGVERSICSGC